ncbi:MAG TPA: hypothetical protein VMS56_06285 [Thermoanaerobaculia bacterium]|nr:hypothetical protein [Thermoanaerobaculia bacterium]
MRILLFLAAAGLGCAAAPAVEPSPTPPHAGHEHAGEGGGHHLHPAGLAPPGSIAVAIFQGGERMVAFEPADQRRPFGGPSVTIWSDPDRRPPRAPDGRTVAGYRFAGWKVAEGAKVAGFALVNPRGIEHVDRDGTHEAVLLDTWIGSPGTEIVVESMRQLGVDPLVIRFLSPAEAFAHDHEH